MDIVDQSTRSRMMAGIRGKNTRPEIVVRTLLHSAGFRYRLHRRDLPGAPDLVLPKYRVAILVHGCFWHLHEGCRFSKVPASNREFWAKKLGGNRERDRRQGDLLRALGWRVLIIWECATRDARDWNALQEKMIIWIKGSSDFDQLSNE